MRTLGALALLGAATAQAQEAYRLSDRAIRIEIEAGERGIALRGITDLRNGIDYLEAPSGLFALLHGAEPVSAEQSGIEVTRSAQPSKREVAIEGVFKGRELGFMLEMGLRERGVVVARLTIENRGAEHCSFGVAFPSITGYRTDGARRKMYGLIPQEIGNAVPMTDTMPPIGMGAAGFAEYLPRAMNNMELCTIYDYDLGNGWFAADVSSDAGRGEMPVQMTLDARRLVGRNAVSLAPGERRTLPEVAIGVFDRGSWMSAVDHYVAARDTERCIPDIPAWLREAGAVYGFSGGGGGGMLLQYPAQELKSRIKSFTELPKLLDEARTLGTDIVYLWDYWNGDDEGKIPWDYWNKGDYIPSDALGGEQAFIEGVKAIHEAGGRVIVYVEPFIILKYSHIGRQIGERTAIRWGDGKLAEFYEHNYSMNPNSPVWTAHLERVIARLVGEYDVDGIFLDSWSWAMNIGCQTREMGAITPADYSLGVLRQTEHLRRYARSIKPDAIVMGETTSGPIWQCWDGGLHADFAWLERSNQGRITASPVRYGRPQANYYANGNNRNQMNQTFAAGHSLILCNKHLEDSVYVRRLVEVRRQYADALIHGQLVDQPYCIDEAIAAYRYEGGTHEVIVVVNTSENDARSGEVTVRGAGRGAGWKRVDGDSGGWSVPHRDRLAFTLGPARMMILARTL